MSQPRISDGRLLDSFMGSLKDDWKRVIEAVNAGDNEQIGEALKAFDEARRRFFKKEVPARIRRKARGTWPYMPEYQMFLLDEYGLPPHVAWTSWTVEGTDLVGLAATRDEANGGSFRLCAARVDGQPIE